MQRPRSLRFWLSGTGRLEELPDVKVDSADVYAPFEFDSFCEISLTNSGCPNDTTWELVQKIDSSPRFRMASISTVLPVAVKAKMPAARYRKEDMVMTDGGYPNHVIWGSDPVAIYREAIKLACEECIEGWEENPIFWPETQTDARENQHTETIYRLVEKPVVDMMAAAKEIGRIKACYYSLPAMLVGIVIGIAIRSFFG